jgi:Putative Ig domain
MWEGKPMRGQWTTTLILALLTVACGGGGNPARTSAPPSSTTQPPAGPPPPLVPSDFVLQYPGPQVFTVGVRVDSDVPVLNYRGANIAWTSPPLPAGLSVNADTGVISGTPGAVTPAASYTISVFNDMGGTAQAPVVIEVNDGPFFYSSPAILAAGAAMTPLSPRGASGTASYSVAPSLPAGLAIDPATGVISGTPASAQPATYYEVSRAEALLTLKFGLTLGVSAGSPDPIAVSSVSTLGCAYSGGFIGTYIGNSQANDEGLIAIAFTPDGNAHARVLDLSNNAVYDSDGLPGLSANLDGSFDINFNLPSGPGPHIHGNFSGADLISGTYEFGGTATPFIASRLGGSPDADFRYTGGFDSSGNYRIDFGVLDTTGNVATGTGYQFFGVGSGYRLINRQLAVLGGFSDDIFHWAIPDDGISGGNTPSTSSLELIFGDPYDALFTADTLGCRLN